MFDSSCFLVGPTPPFYPVFGVEERDVVFLLNDGGELIVARSSRTGFEPLRRYLVAEIATWAQPAISGRRLFIKDVSSLALWALH